MAWEIFSRSVTFEGGRGESTAESFVVVVNLEKRRATRAFSAIGSFDLAFHDTDHHVQQVGIVLQDPELVSEGGAFGVRVRGQIILRDQGRFDDRYRGLVRIVIFADLVP